MKELLGSAIGLARTCIEYERNRQSDKAILKSMEIYSTKNGNPQAQIKKNQEIKYDISPGCKTCLNPCGNTDDYNIDDWENEDIDLVILKKKLLILGSELAKFTSENKILEDFNLDFIYKALYCLAEDWEYEYMEDVYIEGLQVANQLSTYCDVEQIIKEGSLIFKDTYCINDESFEDAISLLAHLYANTSYQAINHLEELHYEVITDLLYQIGVELI